VEFSLQRKKQLLLAPLLLLSLVFASWVAMFRGQVTLGGGAALIAATPLLLMLHSIQTMEGVLLNHWLYSIGHASAIPHTNTSHPQSGCSLCEGLASKCHPCLYGAALSGLILCHGIRYVILEITNCFAMASVTQRHASVAPNPKIA
jgi:hypothetical protein